MEMLNYEQAAEYLDISIPTLKLWVVKKKIPHYKVGVFVRFSIQELEDFVYKDCRVEVA